MGCVVGKRVIPGLEGEEGSVDEYEEGPLSEAQIVKRIVACERTLVAPMATASGHPYTLRYAYVSQRGYYPNALDKENQDAFSVVTSVNGCRHAHLFGVFDGHGSTGDLCSHFAAEKVPEHFCAALPGSAAELAAASDDQVKRALITSYRKTNADLRESAVDDSLSGTTAIGVFLKGHMLYVANTGDSRAILISSDDGGFGAVNGHGPANGHAAGGGAGEHDLAKQKALGGGGGAPERFLAEALSIDQTPFRQDERERVRRAGAVVMTMDQIEGLEPIHDNWGTQLGEEIDESGDPPRVWHQDLDRPGCAFTRSLGDSVGEAIGVVPDPELLIRELAPGDKYVVLASDGVFEFITSQSVAEMVGKYGDPLVAARKVVHEAYKLWLRYEVRTDDITIIVLQFEGLRAAMAKELAAAGHSPGAPGIGRKGSAAPGGAVRDRPAGMVAQEQRPVRRFFSKAKRQVIMEQGGAEDGAGDYDPAEHLVPKAPEETERLRAMVASIFLFQQMDREQLETILGVMSAEEVEAGQAVIREGEKGDKFFVVDSGEYEVTVGDQVVTKYHNAGDAFGELSLLYGKPRTASVTALAHGRLWVLERRAFKNVLIKRIAGFNLLQILRKVPALRPLNQLQLQKLCAKFQESRYRDGDVIIRQGSPGEKFYIIKSGRAVASKVETEGAPPVEIRRMDKYDCFGERALLSNEPRSATMTALGDTVCLWLSRDTFAGVVGDLQTLLQQQIHRQESRRMRRQGTDVAAMLAVQRGGEPLLDRLQLQRAQMRLPHGFVGTFVFRPTGAELSVKVVHKEKAVKLLMEKQALGEREVLQALAGAQKRSPFVAALKHSFQSPHCAFLVLHELVVGDLQQATAEGPLGEPRARYYAACVLSALRFLHEEGVLARRLTPDCVYLTARGVAQLGDVGLAKRMDGQLAYTLAGDAQYFAPEQVSGRGYDYAVDYWGAGVLAYELLHLANPFGDSQTDEKQLYINISQYRGDLPDMNSELSQQAQDLLKGLICKDKTQRLGTTDFSSIENHPWFEGLNWKTLDQEESVPESPGLEAPKTARLRREEVEAEFFAGAEPPPAVQRLFEAFARDDA